MRTYLRTLFLAGCLGMVGCASAPASHTPVSGFVTNMNAFDEFIATHPTAEQFHVAYPDVTLILPGTMATREMRSDNSRYFAEVDASGRITGGKFM